MVVVKPEERHSFGHVEVVLENIDNYPSCCHGPTVCFERYYKDGHSRKFFACSASRDRKNCPFFHWADEKFSTARKETWERLIKDSSPKKTHAEHYARMSVVSKLQEDERSFCSSCNLFVLPDEEDLHKRCAQQMISPISDEHLSRPTQFLEAKESSKVEAQYLFNKQSVEQLLQMVQQSCQSDRVLCVGTPRLHEAIRALRGSLKSFLLDIDERFKNFFSQIEFTTYNMFNHHFFAGENAKENYLQFLKGCKSLVLVCDPPFGGRVELLAKMFAAIQDDWRRAVGKPKGNMKTLFVYPYFMEKQVKMAMPKLTMLDYLVNYDNHPLYGKGKRGMKRGSAVRVYTSENADAFELPESEGYRRCDPCKKWVYAKNVHCEMCKSCTSKDGRTYRHCGECQKCVKPMWKHCNSCSRCLPSSHSCTGLESETCQICGDGEHVAEECTKRSEEQQHEQEEEEEEEEREESSPEKAKTGEKRKVHFKPNHAGKNQTKKRKHQNNKKKNNNNNNNNKKKRV